MLLPVHDSVLLEVPQGAGRRDPADRGRGDGNLPADFSVPLKVDVMSAGRGPTANEGGVNWLQTANCKELAGIA